MQAHVWTGLLRNGPLTESIVLTDDLRTHPALYCLFAFRVVAQIQTCLCPWSCCDSSLMLTGVPVAQFVWGWCL